MLWGQIKCFLFAVGTLLIILPIKAVNPGCECIRYTSTWGKEWGSFSSPQEGTGVVGYPERGTRCLLYSFTAPHGFIVQLHFDRIQLPPPRKELYGRNNGCVDFLKLFIHVQDVGEGGGGGVNENTPWTSVLCGSASNLTFHSSSRHIIVQFHSSPREWTGDASQAFYFNGRYRFLNSSQFTSTGRLMTGTKCDYQFVGVEDGKFFSPHWPSNYPHNLICNYHFYTNSLHKRVKLLFETVSLQPGEYSCLNKTDVIRVIDGSNSKSNVIALLCNSVKDYEILSSGPHLQVEFLANSEVPGTGFKASYTYVAVQLDSALDNTRLLSSPGFFNSGSDSLPQASTLVPQCNQVISSDAGRNGSFSSPNFPNHYSPKTECRYIFIGHGKERVQIQFTDFNLFHPTEKSDPLSPPTVLLQPHHHHPMEQQLLLSIQTYTGSRANTNKDPPSQPHLKRKGGQQEQQRCVGADLLSIWLYSDGQLEKMIELCGSLLPPPIMSNGHRLLVEFKGNQFSRGFHANYAFIEDFAIKSGRQLRDYPCSFMYNSSESSSGTFTSPNYPGLYPRDTDCHYFFYGTLEETVLLTFSYFNIEGHPPCSDNSSSDYLELSNYMHSDSSYGRKCGGGQAPFRIISDSHFFRVSFHSNGVFDGGGWAATFHFTKQPRNDYIAAHDNSIIRLILPGEEDVGDGERGEGNVGTDGESARGKKGRGSASTTATTTSGEAGALVLSILLIFAST